MTDPHLEKYRQALAEKFPELAVNSLKYLSEGWDSVACRVNEELIFRFPKRENVERNLLKEIRLLPELAPRLPLPIPNFKYVSTTPGQHFPFAFVGYEMIEGESLEDWKEEDLAAEWWQVPVGQFLTALHAFPVTRARELAVENSSLTHQPGPTDTWRIALDDYYMQVVEKAFPLLDEAREEALAEKFETFLADKRHFQFEPVLLHADLYYDHILLDRANKQVRGIIDFGDISIGDPAMDLSPEVLPYYGGPTDATIAERHRFYQEYYLPLTDILFGLEHDDKALIERGLAAIG